MSIDTSEIDNLKIDVDDLKVTAEADVKVQLKEGVKSARDQIVDILNDGLPEGEEEQKKMSEAVQTAVGVAYDAIKTKFATKQAELDALYKGGIIDKATYDQSMTELTTQATTMQNELDASASAVNEYVALMIANNRQMTDAEIAELDRLLEQLGITAGAIAAATEAEKQAYAWAYQKTKLGVGDESDAQKAVEYIELVADERLQALKAQEDALRRMYGEKSVNAQTDEERVQLAEEETEALERLEKQREIINAQKLGMQAELMPGLMQGSEVSVEDLEKYVQLMKELEKWNIEATDGLSWNEKLAQWFVSKGGVDNLDADVKQMEEIAKRIEESGLLEEGSAMQKMLATNASQNLLFTPEDLSTTEGVINAMATLATQTLPEVETALEEVKTTADTTLKGEDVGSGMMEGIIKGISDGVGNAERTMRWAMGRITAVAKDELEIHSPSRVFKNEVGAQTMKGFGIGATEELGKQEKLMANAMRHMTGEMQGAAMGGTDNRRTYNTENSVNVTVERLEVRDQQDIQSLATEIASLTRTQQRGRGVRYA